MHSHTTCPQNRGKATSLTVCSTSTNETPYQSCIDQEQDCAYKNYHGMCDSTNTCYPMTFLNWGTNRVRVMTDLIDCPRP